MDTENPPLQIFGVQWRREIFVVNSFYPWPRRNLVNMRGGTVLRWPRLLRKRWPAGSQRQESWFSFHTKTRFADSSYVCLFYFFFWCTLKCVLLESIHWLCYKRKLYLTHVFCKIGSHCWWWSPGFFLLMCHGQQIASFYQLALSCWRK